MADRIAEFLMRAAIHQESAVHALGNGDLEHWCLAATVNVDAPRMVAALRAALALHVRDVIDDMPEPFWYCFTCSGRPKWPCPEVAAISAALTGDGASDA